MTSGSPPRLLFPKWTNWIRPALAAVFVITPAYLVLLVWLGASPQSTDVGYAPVQPVAYSHALHAGELGIDCRYCHTTVETAAHAAVPPTQTCMNCHAKIRTESPKLIAVRESHATGMPVPWVRVHDLPDYVYFNHSAHVKRGVGCVECHGRVDKMEVVTQVEPLSMGWCLDCHRDPDARLRPPDAVTTMDWVAPEDPEAYGKQLRVARNINPPTDCGACHR
ncbi:MAG: cytochrome c3 family protein [Acidobacteriota bacterium]